MDEMFIVMLSVMVAFLFGFGFAVWFGRGFFGKYIMSFFSGRPLVVVMLRKGGATFRLGSHVKGVNLIKFSLWGSSDVRYFSVVDDSSISLIRTRWFFVDEMQTAPFIFKKVFPFEDDVEFPVFDDNGKVVFENGIPKIEIKRVVKFSKFVGYDDNAVIRTLFQWALMRPRHLLGGFDFRILIIILIIIIAGVVAYSFFGGGGEQVTNVIG